MLNDEPAWSGREDLNPPFPQLGSSCPSASRTRFVVPPESALAWLYGGPAHDRHRSVPPPRPDGSRRQRCNEPPAQLARNGALGTRGDALLEPDRCAVHADPGDPDVCGCVGQELVRPRRVRASRPPPGRKCPARRQDRPQCRTWKSTTAIENRRVWLDDSRMIPFETACDEPIPSRSSVRRRPISSTTPSIPGCPPTAT